MDSKALVKAELLQQDYYYDGYRLIASHSFVDFKQKNINKKLHHLGKDAQTNFIGI